MEADKTWYKGGYLRFFFQEITKESIKREKKIDSIVCNIIDLQRKAGELLTQHTPRSLTISRNDAIYNTESCLLLYNFNLLKIPLLNLIFCLMIDCHESRCDSRNDEIANFLSLRTQ